MLIGLKILNGNRDSFSFNELIKKLQNKLNIEEYKEKNFKKYDLIICDNLNNSIFKFFIDNFSNNKKLLILPTSFTFDYLNSNKVSKLIIKNIYPGITEHNNVYRLLNSRSSIKNFENKFIFPLIKFNFNNTLSKEEFFKKYNIPNGYKIITYYDHRMDRGWIKNSDDKNLKIRYNRVKLNQQILMNFKNIYDNFYKLGYIIILKLYKGNYSRKPFNTYDIYKYYKDQIIYDMNEDIRCIYKYTSIFMIGSPSSVMHVPYLYDKKMIYIVKKNSFDWIENRINTHYKKKKNRPNKNNLLCGPICLYKDLIDNPSEIIKNVNEYNFENIDKNNHIILGNSYNVNLDKYCDLLIDKIKEIIN